MLHTLGLTAPPRWLEADVLLKPFGSRERYRAFVGEGATAPSPWAALRGVVLGSDEFVERLAHRLEETAVQPEFSRKERLVHRESLETAFPPPVVADRSRRNARIRELTASGRYSAAEIGRHLGLHYSTVSRIVASRSPSPPPDEQIQDLTPSSPAAG
jgi:hypothetical protein